MDVQIFTLDNNVHMRNRPVILGLSAVLLALITSSVVFAQTQDVRTQPNYYSQTPPSAVTAPAQQPATVTPPPQITGTSPNAPTPRTTVQHDTNGQPSVIPNTMGSEIQPSYPTLSDDHPATLLYATIARLIRIIRNGNIWGDPFDSLFSGMLVFALASTLLLTGWMKGVFGLFKDMTWWEILIMILLLIMLILAILLVIVAFWGEWLLMALVFLAMIAMWFLVWFIAWLMEFYVDNPWLALLLALILLIILLVLGLTPVGAGLLAIIGEILLCVLAFLILLLLVAAAIGLWERFKTYARKNVARWRLICKTWEAVSSKICDQWETQVDKQCIQYAEEIKTECADWAENRYKQCCTWWPCSWLCDAWVWVTEKICMAWRTIKFLVCVAWKWVSTLVCKLWVWVTKLVCKLWVWVLEWAAS